MRLGRITRGAAVAAMTAAAWVAVSAHAQQTKPRPVNKGASTEKASSPRDRASGVITKVERVKSGASSKKGSGGATHRITINTNDLWRDWARDQSQTKDSGPKSIDAAKGRNSIATKGEPADVNSLVVVDVGPETSVMTRFRAPDDETGKGSKTPEGAGGDRDKSKVKPVEFRAEDLKSGLFVEVDYRHNDAENLASTVAVIRPIGGPDSGSADRPK